MRISHLTSNTKLITEGWNDPRMTLLETKVIRPWVGDIERYVVEANLSQAQVGELFKNIETDSNSAGGNRTGIGKGVDVAKLPIEAVKWINSKITELGKAVQNTGPVQNIDAKFAELKTKIGEKDSKVVKAVKAVSDWAKANPGKASIAVAILTTAAAVAGGPLGGAVAGFLARATKDLLQGEKLSTAVGKSAKTAAIGALIGMASEYIAADEIEAIADGGAKQIADQAAKMGADNLKDTMELMPDDVAAVWEQNPNLDVYAKTYNANIRFGTGYGASYQGVMEPDQIEQLKTLAKGLSDAEAIDTFSKEANEAAIKYVEYMRSLKDTNADLNMAAEYLKDAKDLSQAQIDILANSKADLAATVEQVKQAAAGADAAAQGAATAAVDRTKSQESVVTKGQKLSEGQVYMLFTRVDNVNTHMLENKLMFESVFDAVSYQNRQGLNEGPLDALKKIGSGIKKGVKAVGGAIKGAAKQMTTKVTAEKLSTAWKKAGSPSDSNEIYNIIKGLGVNDDVIAGTYNSMKITPPGGKAPTKASPADNKSASASAGASAGASATDNDKVNYPTGTPDNPVKATGGDYPDEPEDSGADAPADPAADPAADVNKDGKISPDEKGNANYKSNYNDIFRADLKQLAVQIKKAGPEVVKIVKQRLAA